MILQFYIVISATEYDVTVSIKPDMKNGKNEAATSLVMIFYKTWQSGQTDCK